MDVGSDWNVPYIVRGRPVLQFWRFDPELARRTNVFGMVICGVGSRCYALIRCEDDWMPMKATVHRSVEAAQMEALRESCGAPPDWERPPN
jgi:hypothetical protein